MDPDIALSKLDPKTRNAIIACTLAARGDVERLKLLLDMEGSDPAKGDYDNRTPLHVAAEAGHLEIVKLLVDRGADVNSVDRWNTTPLKGALKNNNHHTAQYLREHAARIRVSGFLNVEDGVSSDIVAKVRNIFDAIAANDSTTPKHDTITPPALRKYFEAKGFFLPLHKLLSDEVRKVCLDTGDIEWPAFLKMMVGPQNIFQRVCNNDLAVPNWDEFKAKIIAIYDEVHKNNGGAPADYIPELGCADPNWFGVTICTVDGQVLCLGDSDLDFSIQSCGKPLLYSMTVEDFGYDYVHKFVGKEPSGREFNAFTLNYENKPHNSCINAGAIVVSALFYPELNSSGRFKRLTNKLSSLAGGEKIGFSQSVYLSEKETANRNFALMYFMASEGGFPANAKKEDALDFYFQMCSVEISCKKLGLIAATYANYGICPLTGEKELHFETVKQTMQLCLTCGMYDYSGEWACTVGLPAKSGVAGDLWVVVPSKMGICTYSPPLDDIGNSVRGVEFATRITQEFGWSVFDSGFTERC